MLTIFIFVLGLCIGSFLNVLIDRLPIEQSIGGRSYCDHCKKKLAWIDLIPVLSWIYLQGKSRCCRKKISMFYPIVEILTGFAFVIVWISVMISSRGSIIFSASQKFDFLPYLAIEPFNNLAIYFILTVNVILISVLLVIFFSDLKYHIIPDEMTILLVIIGIILIFLRQSFFDNIFGALLLTLLMYSLYYLTKGKGMGFGDVKLAFPIGLILGIKSGLIALYLSFVLGGIFSIFLIILHKRNLKSKIAFGPFMVIGFVIMFFFQEQVLGLVRIYFNI